MAFPLQFLADVVLQNTASAAQIGSADELPLFWRRYLGSS